MRSFSFRLSVFVLTFCIVTPATAANFAVSGTLRHNRGGVELPLDGRGIEIPPFATISQTGQAVPGGGPATIVMPTALFGDVAQPEARLVPVPSIVQLSTSLSHIAPSIATDVLQSGGITAAFAYCPGATANPTCVTAATGGTQGTRNGIVTYVGGPNRYGGSLRMLLSGTATLSTKGSPLPPTATTTFGTTPALPFSVNNLTFAGSAKGIVGSGYAEMGTVVLNPISASHPLSYKMTPFGLLNRGPQVGLAPQYTHTQTGFPLTTGEINISVTQPNPSKLTTTGFDDRTAAGAGAIRFVAASLSRTPSSVSAFARGPASTTGSYASSLTLLMSFTQQPALPANGPTLLLGVGLALMLAGWFVFSRKAAST